MMKTNSFKVNGLDALPIADVLEHNELHSIFHKANMINRLNKTLTNILPTDLAKHCQVMNITDNTLIIEIDSAAWAMQFRYCESQCLQQLQQSKDYLIKKLELRIRPKSPMITPAIQKPILSKTARQLLNKLAMHVSSSKLKQSLEQLTKED